MTVRSKGYLRGYVKDERRQRVRGISKDHVIQIKYMYINYVPAGSNPGPSGRVGGT